MTDYQEPTVIWRTTRTWEGKHDILQLERGEYQGHATYTLRELWVTPDGQTRWAKTRTSKRGDCWSQLKLKSKELKELGTLLLAEASAEQPDLGPWEHPIEPGGPSSGPPRATRQIPTREQRELSKLGTGQATRGSLPADNDLGDLPF